MANIIEVILTAKNNASPEIKRLTADVQSLDKAVGTLTKIATLDFGLSGLQAAFGTIQQIGQAVADVSQAGSQFTRLNASFENLASGFGSSGTAIISAIEEVTQGTLSQQVIMQQANNAMLLGVADTADEFSTLAKIAVDRGRAMGISMEYAFESIVKGVGRLSPLILDNLGIVLDADKTYKDYAETIGKTADALTDAEKRQALLARLKAEVQDFDSSAVMDAAAAWERFSASIMNATAVAGEWINQNTGLIASINGISDALNIVSANMSDDTNVKIRGITAEIEIAQDQLLYYKQQLAALEREDTSNPISAALKGISETGVQKAVDDWQRQLDTLVARMDVLRQAAVATKDDMSDLGIYKQRAEMQALEVEYANGATAVAWYAKALGISKDEAEAQIQSTIRLKGSWAAAAPAIAEAGNQAILAAQRIAQATSMLNSAISSIQSSALQAYSDSGYNSAIVEQFQNVQLQAEGLRTTVENMDPTEAQFYMRQFTDEASAGFKAVSEYANQTEKSIGGAGSATKSLTKEFTDLRSIVDGLVSSAMQDIGGADLSKYLPYQDAPAEDARRIASVMVEGYDSEWADYFKEKFPLLFSQYMLAGGGDIQKASALLLKDFQDGLRPELLDKGKIKELAKKMFFADQETTKMVDEIARDLAKELGITIEEAKAAVGGAAGVKKKPMTKEEIEKLFGGVDMTPKWDMSGSKERFKAAGVAAGVLDTDGNLLVPVKVQFTELEGNTITGDYKLQISGFTFSDLPNLKLGIVQSLGVISLTFSPNPSTEFYTNLQTNVYDYIAGKSAAIKIVPAAFDPTVFDNWVTGAESFITAIDININPTMSTDTFEAVFAPIRTALRDTFVTQETADTMMFNLGAAMGLAIFNNPDDFNWQGRYIGILMMNSFEEYNVGQLIANSIANQLTQAEKTFQVAAANSGKAWGNAFLSTVKENVPQELINILTDLVTPNVQKKSTEAKGRGGAE